MVDDDLSAAHARGPSAPLRTVRPRLTLLSSDSALTSRSLRSLWTLRTLSTWRACYALVSLGSLRSLWARRSLWAWRSQWSLFSLGPFGALWALVSLSPLLSLNARRPLSAGVTLNAALSDGSLGPYRSLCSLRAARSAGVSPGTYWAWRALRTRWPHFSLWSLGTFRSLWSAWISLRPL